MERLLFPSRLRASALLVLISLGPANPAAAATICNQYDTVDINAKTYVVQNNMWNVRNDVNGWKNCMTVDEETGAFAITEANHGMPTDGAPAGYPSIFKGCHWGNCTDNSGMPVRVSAISSATSDWETAQPNNVTEDVAYNVAYDLWFNSSPTTKKGCGNDGTADCGPDKAELMIWLNRVGGVQPFGEKIAGGVSIAGTTWDVWFGKTESDLNTISYVRTTGVTRVSNLDLTSFMDDAWSRCYVLTNWYLISVEAGFEIWKGGAGLASDSFSVSVSGGSAPTHTATATIPAQTPPATLTATPIPTASSCVGDCDRSAAVDVAEIITLVNIALGSRQPSACPHGIPSGSQVDIAVIIQAVNNALNGCATTVGAWLTTGDQLMLLQPQPTIAFGSGSGSASIVITVDDSVKYQQMDGFGASLTDSSAWLVWTKLTDSGQDDLWRKLFSPVAGVGLSFLRQPMGASDFSATGNYSYDDLPAGETEDPSLANFSIHHDTDYIIPLLLKALAVNPAIKIVAVPWSPPAWMKTTGTMNGGKIDKKYFPSLAQYFVKFLLGYEAERVPIYAISVQNEPLKPAGGYPSAELTAADEAAFIGRHLGPALRDAGLGNVKILAYEHNWDNTDYPKAVLGDASAADYVAGSAFHCYRGDVSTQSEVHDAYPSKDIWFTECSGTVGSSFACDLRWNAENLLIGATRNWARSVSLWNLALDQNSGPKNGGCQNCRGVVTVDDRTSPPTITYNVEYYALGHLAKFVVPGAHRIDSNSFDPGSREGIEDVAFWNPDGSIVLLVLNSSSGSRTFAVSWQQYSFDYTLPGGAVATFRWDSAAHGGRTGSGGVRGRIS